MKKSRFILTFIITYCVGTAQYSAFAQNNFWLDVPETRINIEKQQRKVIPNKYRTLSLDTSALLAFLEKAPHEFTEEARTSAHIIFLPMPEGGFSRFRIVKTSMMAPELAVKFPEIKTYSGQGVDDSTATIIMDWTANGFHAMILSSVNESIFIDPYATRLKTKYICYFKKDMPLKVPFIERMDKIHNNGQTIVNINEAQEDGCTGGILRTYRIAVACTGEYAQAVGGETVTLAEAQGAIMTSIDQISGIYQKELSIKLMLISNNEQIVFTDPLTDPFDGNNNDKLLIIESQTEIDAKIGSANFDLGITFCTFNGGLAAIGAVCDNSQKAQAMIGSSTPNNRAFVLNAAHEIGHLFGANHTFNANSGECLGEANDKVNAEPGSGTTIMSYAGVCKENNLELEPDMQFHAVSFKQINDYINSLSTNNCAAMTPTGNLVPFVNACADYIIPKNTPFIITGFATDKDADALTYSWEQIDVGGPNADWNMPIGPNAPLFRSFPPKNVSERIFPQLSDILNQTTTKGEILPSYGRPINMQLTVRDGKGGVCSDKMMITVKDDAGPFEVTEPNAALIWPIGCSKKVTWNVNNTNGGDINCKSVRILLSIDGGLNFSHILATQTVNDGEEIVIVPNLPSTRCRVKVEAIGNIFFDVSNNNFTIVNPNYTITASPQTSCFANLTVNASTSLTGSVFEYSLDNSSFQSSNVFPGRRPNVYLAKVRDKTTECTFERVISIAPIPGEPRDQAVPNVAVPAGNFTFCHGEETPAISFAGSICDARYEWVSTIPVGLGSFGTTGKLLPFHAVNNTDAPITTTIGIVATVNRQDEEGRPIVLRSTGSFTITVKPSPRISPTPVAQTICEGDAITIKPNASPGTRYFWERDNVVNVVGMPNSGEGTVENIVANLTLRDEICEPQITTLTFRAEADGCPETSTTVRIAINPKPIVHQLSDRLYCKGATVDPIRFSSNVKDVMFKWTVDGADIGVGGPAFGDIPAFVAENSSNQIISAQVAVTAFLIQSRNPLILVCEGPPMIFNIYVDPCNSPPLSVIIPDAKAPSSGVNPNTVYPAYPPAAAITLTAQVSGGNGTYNYKWSNGANTASITVNPSTTTVYTVTITDGSGNTQTATKQVNVVDIKCGTNNNKLKVCIVPLGYTGNAVNSCVDGVAVGPLLANGSRLGTCNEANVGVLTLKAVPNPTFTYFNLTINSSNPKDKITLTVRNIFGKVVESKTVTGNSNIQIGANYYPGVYFAEVVQGANKTASILVKL